MDDGLGTCLGHWKGAGGVRAVGAGLEQDTPPFALCHTELEVMPGCAEGSLRARCYHARLTRGLELNEASCLAYLCIHTVKINLKHKRL